MGIADSVIFGRVRILRLTGRGANAMTRQMAETLRDLAEDTARRDDIGAVVLTGGQGAAFCAGSDLRELSRLVEEGHGPRPLLNAEAEAFSALSSLPQPLIAAIEGPAVGGGLELMLCADLVVASETARFALPEVHVGVFPCLGGTTRLQSRIGGGRTREMLLLGEEIDARTAHAWGLVNRLTPPHMAYHCARRIADRLARGPGHAHAAIKTSLDEADRLPPQEALSRALAAGIAHAGSTDATEGMRAFTARRRPDFVAARAAS